MAAFKISGVWKDNNVITYYAFHTVTQTGISRAQKVSKADAIKLLETIGNTAITWIWNYSRSFWDEGEKVTVINVNGNKFLRSNPDRKVTDNLAHLIDYDWIDF